MLRVQICVPEVFNPSKSHKAIIFCQQENRKKKWILEKMKTYGCKHLKTKALMTNKRNW